MSASPEQWIITDKCKLCDADLYELCERVAGGWSPTGKILWRPSDGECRHEVTIMNGAEEGGDE